jgi:hypothetical protein
MSHGPFIAKIDGFNAIDDDGMLKFSAASRLRKLLTIMLQIIGVLRLHMGNPATSKTVNVPQLFSK